MENFGSCEKVFTLSEKEKIKKFLKFDSHVNVKFVEQILSAESESSYFERLGKVAGVSAGLSFFFFPVIRQQPIIRRSMLALVPYYLINRWCLQVKEDIEWGKVYNVFQKWQISHGQNPKVFI